MTADGLRVIAAVRDISERVLAEARMREVQGVLDATRDAVLVFDPDTLVFAYVNQGAIDQLGYSRDELLTMTPLHIKPALTEAAYRELMASVAPGESHTYTTVHRRKDGDDMQVEAVLVRAPDQPGGEGWLVSIARDITERLEAEDRAHTAERQVVVLEDRQRIARDLHDLVIQRLFASGLGLSGIAAAVGDPALAQRLNATIDDLDETIRQLRVSIFELNQPSASTSLRATLLDVCRGERAALGFDPGVRFEGPIDSVDDGIRPGGRSGPRGTVECGPPRPCERRRGHGDRSGREPDGAGSRRRSGPARGRGARRQRGA